jgi:cytochrome c-type biogenesis protein CcmF
VIGLAGAAFNQDKEQEIGKGDTVKIGSYTVVGEEYTEDDNANYRSQAALLEVYKDGKYLTRLNPEERFFKASGGQPVHIVANHSTLREDLYVVYEGRNPDTDHPIIKIIINPLVNWIWIGVLVIVIGTGMALIPNASLVTVPVRSTVAVAQMEERGMHPAGAAK